MTSLYDQDLDYIGVKLPGHRKKLLLAAKTLQSLSTTAAAKVALASSEL